MDSTPRRQRTFLYPDGLGDPEVLKLMGLAILTVLLFGKSSGIAARLHWAPRISLVPGGARYQLALAESGQCGDRCWAHDS